MSDEYLTRDKNRYARISPSSIYESQVSSLVERNLAAIFPDYFGARCDPYLRTAAGDVQPDLVMIKKDFSGWALIEVEDENHPFRRHVLPQVSKMTFAEADEKTIARVWKDVAPLQNISRVEEALSHRPKVFLVTHGTSSRYETEIVRLGVEPIDIDIHESITQPNEYVLVIHDRATALADLHVIATRSQNPITKFFWTIKSEILEELLREKTKAEVILDNNRSLWNVVTAQDGVILRQPSDMSLSETILAASVHLNEESGAIHLLL